jgi:HPt (histidine-containing phosphotransfer) domain-containing protein
MSNDLELYKASGMADCIGKPFTSQQLWKCLAKYLTVEFAELSESAESSLSLHAEDEKLKKRLQTTFVKNNQNVYAEFTEALNAGDIKLAHRIAHTLKGNAGQIGEIRLQEIAAETEAMLSGGENRLDENQMQVFEYELGSVLGKLAPLLVKPEAEPGKETPGLTELNELIEKLEPMLHNRNPECMNLLDDILSIPGTEELAAQVENMKFKKAIEELLKLKEKQE